MDKKTKGAWLLSQAKSLDAVSGALRLENIQYAGKAGRLYNLLRRNVQGEIAPRTTYSKSAPALDEAIWAREDFVWRERGENIVAGRQAPQNVFWLRTTISCKPARSTRRSGSI